MTERHVSLSLARFGRPVEAGKLILLAVLGVLALASAAEATVLSREQDILDLKLGQRVRIDDGTCPAGQVKEVSGAKMGETGVVRARRCVPRTGPKVKPNLPVK
jgi:hypothetical protein